MITSVDCVLLTLENNLLKVLLIKREHEPFKNNWTLCGGYIDPLLDKDDFACANRILFKKTGVEVNYLEQLKTFASATRDPRDWSMSITWYALVNADSLRNMIKAHSTKEPSNHAIKEMDLFDVDNLPTLGFDHNEIVQCAVNRVRNKSLYSSLVGYLLNKEFTLAELQSAYEAVLKEKINTSVFRRKLQEFDFVEEVPNKLIRKGANRPAQVYQLKDDLILTKKTFKN